MVVNLLAINKYDDPNCLVNCPNSNMKTVNYVMFFMGVCCIILLLIYLILMPFYIIDYPNLRKKYKMQKEFKSHYPNEILKHSTLYAQNNLQDWNIKSNRSNSFDFIHLLKYCYCFFKDFYFLNPVFNLMVWIYTSFIKKNVTWGD